jgi:hypothetical protein
MGAERGNDQLAATEKSLVRRHYLTSPCGKATI